MSDCRSEWVTDWLIDWMAYWLSDWMGELLDGLLIVWLDWSTGWLADFRSDWSTEWLTHSVTEWLTDCLTGWVSYWLTDRLNDSLTQWLNGWRMSDWTGELLTDWSTEWLTHSVNGWLIDCMTGWLTHGKLHVKTAPTVFKFDAQRRRVCIDLRRSRDRNTVERWCNVTSQVYVQNVRLSYIRGRWGGGGVGALHRLLGMPHCYVMVLHLTLKLPRSDC